MTFELAIGLDFEKTWLKSNSLVAKTRIERSEQNT